MSSLRDHLETIRQKHGYLDPDLVVDEARAKTHPLHDRFEWDDKLAGASYRRDQAHRLIQSVRIQYITSDRPKDVRAYLAVPRPDSKQPIYEPTDEIMRDDLLRTVVLGQMEREWRALQARYGDLAEFAELVQASLEQAA